MARLGERGFPGIHGGRERSGRWSGWRAVGCPGCDGRSQRRVLGWTLGSAFGPLFEGGLPWGHRGWCRCDAALVLDGYSAGYCSDRVVVRGHSGRIGERGQPRIDRKPTGIPRRLASRYRWAPAPLVPLVCFSSTGRGRRPPSERSLRYGNLGMRFVQVSEQRRRFDLVRNLASGSRLRSRAVGRCLRWL